MLTEMLEAAWPGKWTVIKRRERTNVYPSPQPGYEIQCPPGIRFCEGYGEGFGYRHGLHSRHFDDAEAVKRLAANIDLAVELCPPDCECRIQKRIAEHSLLSELIPQNGIQSRAGDAFDTFFNFRRMSRRSL